jgi:hypothetical protein
VNSKKIQRAMRYQQHLFRALFSLDFSFLFVHYTTVEF